MNTTYSVCIIDDGIPTHHFPNFMEDSKILNENNFKHLLNEKIKWDKEVQLFDLVEGIFKNKDYILSGFRTHDFFLNHIAENIFSPDIVIFDWDVDTKTDPKLNLLEILKSKYCLIAIYTGVDNTEEISVIIEGDEFLDYKNRLFLMEKKAEDSVDKLTNEIESKLKVFSFKLGQNLKKDTLQAVDNILVNIGKLSFDQFVTAFGEYSRETQETSLSKIDFIDIIISKLQAELLNVEFSTFPLKASSEEIKDNELLKKLWHYRLYHRPKDAVIRKGDIIRKNDDNRLFLILTSDCHLDQFWKKNLGYLTLVPLYRIDDSDVRRRISDYINQQTIPQFKISSMVNPQKIENITILPSIIKIDVKKDNEQKGDSVKYLDYILSPKEIFSVEIPKPDGLGPNVRLETNHLIDYNGNDRTRIGEPFLSPLTQFILSQVAGYGTPDYSKELQTILVDSIKSIVKNDEA